MDREWLSDFNVLSSGVILSTAVQLMTENCCPAIHVISDRIGRHGPNNLGDTVTRTIRAPWDCWKNPLISSQPMSANQCFHLSIGKFYTWLKMWRISGVGMILVHPLNGLLSKNAKNALTNTFIKSFLIACYSLTTTWWQNFGTKLVDTLFFDLAVINTYCLILAVLSTQSLVLLCLWQGLKNTQSVVVPFSHTSVPSEKWKWFQISFCSLLTPRIQMVSASDSRDIIKDDLCASNTVSDG